MVDFLWPFHLVLTLNSLILTYIFSDLGQEGRRNALKLCEILKSCVKSSNWGLNPLAQSVFCYDFLPFRAANIFSLKITICLLLFEMIIFNNWTTSTRPRSVVPRRTFAPRSNKNLPNCRICSKTPRPPLRHFSTHSVNIFEGHQNTHSLFCPLFGQSADFAKSHRSVYIGICHRT